MRGRPLRQFVSYRDFAQLDREWMGSHERRETETRENSPWLTCSGSVKSQGWACPT